MSAIGRGQALKCQAAPRAAQFINLEKEIGAFNVRTPMPYEWSF